MITRLADWLWFHGLQLLWVKLAEPSDARLYAWLQPAQERMPKLLAEVPRRMQEFVLRLPDTTGPPFRVLLNHGRDTTSLAEVVLTPELSLKTDLMVHDEEPQLRWSPQGQGHVDVRAVEWRDGVLFGHCRSKQFAASAGKCKIQPASRFREILITPWIEDRLGPTEAIGLHPSRPRLSVVFRHVGQGAGRYLRVELDAFCYPTRLDAKLRWTRGNQHATEESFTWGRNRVGIFDAKEIDYSDVIEVVLKNVPPLSDPQAPRHSTSSRRKARVFANGTVLLSGVCFGKEFVRDLAGELSYEFSLEKPADV